MAKNSRSIAAGQWGNLSIKYFIRGRPFSMQLRRGGGGRRSHKAYDCVWMGEGGVIGSLYVRIPTHPFRGDYIYEAEFTSN